MIYHKCGMARFHSLGESLCAFIERLFSWILYRTLDSCNIIFLYEFSCVFAFSDQCWMLCHKLDIFCIILESCSPLSSLAVGILCIFFTQRLHLNRIIWSKTDLNTVQACLENKIWLGKMLQVVFPITLDPKSAC